MAKSHVVFDMTVHGQQTIIKCVENEDNGKKQYYVYESIPKEFQQDQNKLYQINQNIEKENAEHGGQYKLVYNLDENGNKKWFIREKSSLVKAFIHSLSVEKEAKKEAKIIDEINNKAVTSSTKTSYKKTSGNVKAKLIALGLGATIFIGSIAGTAVFFSNNNIDMTNNGGSGYASSEQYGSTQEKTPTNKQEQDKELVYTNLDTVTYKTHKNSTGETLMELADSVKVADICYNNLKIELEKASHDYHFDVSKFDPSMFVGEQIRESSLKLNKEDIGDACRGPFKMGAEAIDEANEVSMKLTGKKIIETVDDIYDPVKACMTCMYIAVRNYEYCYDIVQDKVTPNMVFDTYLFGCGNVRKWLREDIQKGDKYEAKSYSKDVLYYGECVEEYKEALDKGLTDGSHDKYWQDTYYNGLWKLPNWNEQTQTQPGE